MRLAIVLLALASFPGCASIVSTFVYPVTVDSIPTGAKFVIRNKRGKIIHHGVTPARLYINASNGFFQYASYEIEARLPGYNHARATISAGLDGWYIGNIVFGGLIGFLIVDPGTGAMWRLGDRVTVNLGAPTDAPALTSAIEGPLRRRG